MIRAYMDESGTHEGSHNSLFAGYWGSGTQWRLFSQKWGRILHKYEVDEFHAREYWKRNDRGEGVGKYRGWDRDKLAWFLGELLHVIAKTEIYPFASGVLTEEWIKRSLEERRYLSGGYGNYSTGAPSSSQYMGFQLCIYTVASYCKPGTRAHFVCDNDPKRMGWTQQCYANFRARMFARKDELADRLGDITFSDSRKTAPLQAADLLAYEAHRWSRKAYQASDMRHPVDDVYGRALIRFRGKQDFILFDGPRFEQLERLAEMLKEDGN